MVVRSPPHLFPLSFSFPFVSHLPLSCFFSYTVHPKPSFVHPKLPKLPMPFRTPDIESWLSKATHSFRFVPPLSYLLPFIYYLFSVPLLVLLTRSAILACVCHCTCFLLKLQIACLAICPVVAWYCIVVLASLYSFSVA